MNCGGKPRKHCRIAISLAFGVLLLGSATRSLAYSLLTHEQIVDIAWEDNIEPILQKRLGGATTQDLRTAHAFAYGGCLIQDIGYYPFGSHFSSDLTHYVRCGVCIASPI